jgi:hypothetical protein
MFVIAVDKSDIGRVLDNKVLCIFCMYCQGEEDICIVDNKILLDLISEIKLCDKTIAGSIAWFDVAWIYL